MTVSDFDYEVSWGGCPVRQQQIDVSRRSGRWLAQLPHPTTATTTTTGGAPAGPTLEDQK